MVQRHVRADEFVTVDGLTRDDVSVRHGTFPAPPLRFGEGVGGVRWAGTRDLTPGPPSEAERG